MVAGAVEKQAGTTDMTKVSGLIRKMPWTFFVALVSIIALAGVPPVGGFVGKWLIYESLITESNNYILVVVVFFSSTAAFLYSYRFLFGLFLGQEEEETKDLNHGTEPRPTRHLESSRDQYQVRGQFIKETTERYKMTLTTGGDSPTLLKV